MKSSIRFVVAVAVAASAFACGSSVQGTCQNNVNATCSAFKRCNDGGYTVTSTSNGCSVAFGSGSSSFTFNVGTNTDGGPTCFAGMTANNVCGPGSGPDGGTGTYSQANADQCTSDLNSASCSNSQTLAGSGACAHVCGQ